jgi:hypothetical protein
MPDSRQERFISDGSCFRGLSTIAVGSDTWIRGGWMPKPKSIFTVDRL